MYAHLMHKLTQYEQTEILSYSEVFFVGQNAKKIHSSWHSSSYQNGGYDDEQGSYRATIHDHIAYRYEILKVLGKGTFGQVLKCYDHKTGKYVAVKMVRNEKKITWQAHEEIRILENLRRQDYNSMYNIIHMIDSFTFRNHICIVFELLSMNLYEVIKKNGYAGFPMILVKKIIYHLLHCLDFLNRNRIIHCDLKPENIMLKQPGRSSLKVIDFGSSCYENQRIYTYIQSRYYRAPEVILGNRYGMQIDMWSLGCILVELITGYPLFPGEDENDQMACIMELCGLPPRSIIDFSKRKNNFFNSRGLPKYCTYSTSSTGQTVWSAGRSMRGKTRGVPGSKSYHTALRGLADASCIDFIKKCLEWDPNKRMTPQQALRHPWTLS
jgi:dual specificity tyrosine-phosphorylation-regulated kinase 2/3/4